MSLTTMQLNSKSIKVPIRLPQEVFFGSLIWLELHTGNTLIIDLFVAIMMTGGIFYTMYASVFNYMFKNNHTWRFTNE